MLTKQVKQAAHRYQLRALMHFLLTSCEHDDATNPKNSRDWISGCNKLFFCCYLLDKRYNPAAACC